MQSKYNENCNDIEEQTQYIQMVQLKNENESTQFGSQPEQIVNNNIVDIQFKSSSGNFIPHLYGLQHNYIQHNELDQFGYNIIHHAVAFNNFPVVVTLVEKYKIDINIRSQILQTPLMIASNYGFIKIAKYLIQNGADINAVDELSLNPLLYAIKNNRTWMTIYLLAQGADKNCADVQGRDIQHWAAYVNNVFLLDLFVQFGLDIAKSDLKGHTPLIKAIFNESYDAIKYILDKNDEIVPEFLLTDKIKSESIKKMIKDYERNQKLKKIMAYKMIKENLKVVTQIFLIMCASSIYFSYLAGCAHKLSNHGFVNLLNILMNLLVFFYVPILFYFVGKVQGSKKCQSFKQQDQRQKSFQKNQDSQQKINEKDKNLIEYTQKEIKNLNKLIQQSDTVIEIEDTNQIESNQVYSFMHDILKLIRNDKFQEIEQLNQDKICVPCLEFKKERMHHCPNCDICIEKFNQHSKFFDKCISRENHRFYYLILSIQQLGLFLYIFLNLIAYWKQLIAWKIFFVVEIPYIMFFLEKSVYQIWITLGYFIALFLLFQNTIDWVIESYGIINNLTRYEIFNVEKCYYFFEKIHLDYDGNVFRIYDNKFNKGFVKNIKQYLKDSQSQGNDSGLL